jgi:DNA-binding transcriptional LysR family regulator
MPKRTSPADSTPVRVVLLTLDGHVGGAVGRAAERLRKELPGLVLSFHAASEWENRPQRLQQCIDDIGRGDLIIGTMLFTDSHIQMIRPALEARRESCDAMLICISAQEVASLTRLGKFRGDSNPSGLVGLLKRLRGRPGASGSAPAASSGARQVKMLRRIPKMLRFVPGTAQDLRAYLLAMQYWLAGSEDNLANLVRLLVDRYAEGPRKNLRGRLTVAPPIEYPDVALYHPTLPGRVTERAGDLPTARGSAGTVGLMIMRSYVLSDDAGHYDAVIAALPIKETGLSHRVLFEDRFVMAVSNNDRDILDSPLNRHKAAFDRLLLLEEGHCLRDQALSVCQEHSDVALVNFGATSLTTLLQMVAHGMGRTLLPEIALSAESPRLGDIRFVPFAPPAPSREIAVFFRSASERQADYEAFADVAAEIGNDILKAGRPGMRLTA